MERSPAVRFQYCMNFAYNPLKNTVMSERPKHARMFQMKLQQSKRKRCVYSYSHRIIKSWILRIHFYGREERSLSFLRDRIKDYFITLEAKLKTNQDAHNPFIKLLGMYRDQNVMHMRVCI